VKSESENFHVPRICSISVTIEYGSGAVAVGGGGVLVFVGVPVGKGSMVRVEARWVAEGVTVSWATGSEGEQLVRMRAAASARSRVGFVR
jgi:hypothetical protein